MIVFLNGPFGIGKTTTARLLAERLAPALLFDPEDVGAFLRRVLRPVEEQHDYQDYTLWPPLVVAVTRRLREAYPQPLLMPMTILRRDRFDAIAGGLRQADPDLLCLRLTAPRDELVRRILARPDALGGHQWCLEHLDAGLAAAADPAFGAEVATGGRTPEEVAEAVLALLPASALPH